MNIEIDTLVIERSPGRSLDRLVPDLGLELVRAGVPPERAGDVARSVIDHVRLEVGR